MGTTFEKIKFQVPRINRDVLFNDGGTDRVITVINDKENETFFRITGIAALVWKEIDGKKTIKKILDEVAKETGLPATRIQLRLTKFINALKKEKLIS